MADPRFHRNAGPFSIAEIAKVCNAEIQGLADSATVLLKDVASLDAAGEGDLSFLDNIKYRDRFAISKATACIVAPDMVKMAPACMALLVTSKPYAAYAMAAQLFYPAFASQAYVSPSAVIAADAIIGRNCRIDHGAVVGAGAEIGDDTIISVNAVVGDGVVIGRGCRIGSCASISHSLIGDNVVIYPGCRIGQDGFGFAPDPAGFIKVPQLGRVLIEDGVEIGANTTIDRGAGPDTVIGAGTWIDNLVQIGHNVKIGKSCVIVAQVGISGSTIIEDFVMIGGQAGFAGHLRIGRGAKIAAQSGVMRDMQAGEQVMGSPAVPMREGLRQAALLGKLSRKKE